MKAVFLTLLLSLVALSVQAAESLSPAVPPPRDLAELDTRLADLLRTGGVPGAAVVVVENGQVVLSKGYGVADVAKQVAAGPDTAFGMGSISKTIVGLAVMLLVEEGMLDLQARLADLAPEIAVDNPWESTDPIRLVHLLEHTAGFDDFRFRHFLLDGRGMSLAQAVEAHGPYASRWKPGVHFSYSNAGAVIAARLVEKASGMPWREFTRRRIFEPLGMASAAWEPAGEVAGQLAKSYRFDGKTEEHRIHLAGGPAGGLLATPKDMARLLAFFLGRGSIDGRQLLKPESVARIEAPQSTLAARLGLPRGYGIGVTSMASGKGDYLGHDGGVEGFMARMLYEPRRRSGFALILNAPLRGPQYAATQTIEAYLERDWSEPTAAAPVSPSFDALTGWYLPATARFQLLAPVNDLLGWARVRTDGEHLRVNHKTLLPLSPTVFRDTESVVPYYAFHQGPEGAVLATPFGDYRRAPLANLVLKAGLGLVFALCLVVNLVMLAVWGVAGCRGRLRSPGALRVRLLPALAVLSLAAALVTVAVTLAIEPFAAVHLLGQPTAVSWFVFALSLVVPAVAAFSLAAAVRAPAGTPWPIRILAWSSSVVAVAGSLYLASHGWIGLRTWT